jgi:prevent-host-death family protein
MKTQLKKSAKSGRLKKAVHVKVARQVQTSYTATEAKNEFGRLLEKAMHGTTVVITKHQSPRAVLISMDKFEALAKAPEVKLNTLSEQFDALLSRMQAPAVRRQMSAAFKASPKELGEAAVAAARKRG